MYFPEEIYLVTKISYDDAVAPPSESGCVRNICVCPAAAGLQYRLVEDETYLLHKIKKKLMMIHSFCGL